MSELINVLDHGFVRYIEHMGSDLTVVNAARVSFNKESDWDSDPHWTGTRERKLSDKDKKLIGYLAKNNHWTPFAHPQITIHIKTPIFIRAQLGKHQVGLVMNEVSRRYVVEEPQFYTPIWRGAPTNGAKQGSSEFITDEQIIANNGFAQAANECVKVYNHLLGLGVAPEQARGILPQATYTEWWWTGSLSAFARVYKQRIDAHAQWEVRCYAEAIGSIIQPLFPVSWEQLVS
jgi:thymidylate synthase (FAD)